MPMISPWSTNPKTTKVGDTNDSKKFVFRAAFIDDFQGRVAAKFAIDQLKTTKPGVLYDVTSEYNKGIAEFYKKTLEENGVQVVAFETYSQGDKDFSAQLTKIKDAGANWAYSWAPWVTEVRTFEALRRLGWDGDYLTVRRAIEDGLLGVPRFYEIGIWRYGAEPGDGDGDARILVDSTDSPDGHLVGEAEGLTIFYGGEDGAGYLIASSEGSNDYVLYRRTGDHEFVRRFAIGDGNGIDGTSDTDGIALATFAGGGGLFVASDRSDDALDAENFKLVDLVDLANVLS